MCAFRTWFLTVSTSIVRRVFIPARRRCVPPTGQRESELALGAGVVRPLCSWEAGSLFRAETKASLPPPQP